MADYDNDYDEGENYENTKNRNSDNSADTHSKTVIPIRRKIVSNEKLRSIRVKNACETDRAPCSIRET